MYARRLIALCSLALLGLVPAAGADTLLTLKTHQDGYEMAGQEVPAADSTVEMWIGDGRVSRADGQNTVILRSDRDEMYVINHEEQTYARIELPFDFSSMIPEGMEQMAAQWSMEADVTAVDETKTVGDWSVRRYDIAMSNPMGLGVETVLWATEEIEIPLDTYYEMADHLRSMQPGGAEMSEEMAEIKGYPVLQETTVDMGGTTYTTREELISAESGDAPEGTYEVPEGYTEKDLRQMAGGGPPGA